MATKKYYWLKLKNDFFTNKKIKKLRKIAGGDTYTIIYLKMQLLSIKDNGKLFFENVEDSFAEELALELDEEIENVKVTLMFLVKNGLLVEVNPEEYVLPETIECIGSETNKAELMRKKRAREKLLNGNIVTPELPLVTNSYTEIEKEKEIDIDIDIKEDKEIKKETKSRFKKPTLEEVEDYCKQRQNNINPEHFIDYYEANGWKVGKNSMKDWKAAIRTWEKREFSNKTTKPIREEIVPEWFNKDIEKKPMSKNDEEELKSMLAEFDDTPFEERKEKLQERLKAKYGKKGNDE